jgi:hypothetical protein
MQKVSHKRRKYTSDVSDGQWKRMVWLFPSEKGQDAQWH